jgi:hypothetical protein
MTMEQTVRAEALFLSDLQPSQCPTSEQIAAAVEAALRRLGSVGCAAATAAEYGEHPDTAPARMRWALAALV